ncbi:MAG: phosphonoacetaldehyde hydrolase [Planctomycetaceae bacterium]|nr:phosphonoacetaldehyde hydrolase [Planctomycetaceae bacterium]
MSEPFRHLKAVIFDWAGTTVDHGSRAPALVFREIFHRQGIEITLAQARGPMGLAKRDHIAALLRLPDVREAWLGQHGAEATDADIDSLYADFLPLQKETLVTHTEIIDGVVDSVAQCRQRGLSIGSSTGYTHELVDVFAEQIAQQGYRPDCVLCSEDAPQGRPAPWLIFNAAQQMGVFPMCHIVKVDDTTPGIEAGKNAGCWTVGITRTGNEVGLTAAEFAALSADEQNERLTTAANKLKAAGADFILESVAELIPLLEEINDRLKNGERP